MLRPMTSGEVLDLALRAFRYLGGPILRLSAVPALLCYVVIAFFTAFVLPSIYLTRNPQSIEFQVLEVIFVLVVALFIALPLWLLGISYISGLVTRLISDFILGQSVDIESATQNARQSLKTVTWTVVGTFIASFSILAIAVGLLLLAALLEGRSDPNSALPAVVAALATIAVFVGFLALPFVMSRQALAPAIAVLEGATGRAAARRSVALLKGTKTQESASGKMWMLWLLATCVFLAVSLGTYASIWILELPNLIRSGLGATFAADVAVAALEMLPVYLSLWVLIPLWSSATTILYYDRRIRLEGYDIELLSLDARRTSRQSRFQL